MEDLNYLEISKNNLLHNLRLFKNISSAKVAVVVKGNAYGHGLEQVCCALDGAVDFFQVDDFEELKELRKYTQTKALVLGYVQPDKINYLPELNAVPGLYDAKIINGYSGEYHLKIDAFLGRQGVLTSELPGFLEKIKNKNISGVYSHFSSIENLSNLEHFKKQLADFKKALNILKAGGIKFSEIHTNATSGLLVNGNLKTTINRLGAGIYGLWPSPSLRKNFESKLGSLKPVLKWVSHIAQVKVLPKNYPIGYGLTYFTPKKMRVAVIPQGYSDGYDRKLSNQGEVLIGGKRYRVLGRVSMNMMVVDVDDLKNVKAGDEVVLLGQNKHLEISADELAQKIGTINYEVTSRISSTLPRKLNLK